MRERALRRNYRFMFVLMVSMILGAVTGWIAPEFGRSIAFLGTIFINLMFCIVVPLVFASIAGAVANMRSRRRAGRIVGVTIAVFLVTGALAAVLCFLLVQIFPPVPTMWTEFPTEEMGEYASIQDLVVNFFTASDFVGLLSRRAMLPLIVAALLFGFATNLCGRDGAPVAAFLASLNRVMLQLVQIVSYYAPVAFFAIFADLVASYGPQITGNYMRALALYYPLCFLYLFTAFPFFAWFGGGKEGVAVMFQHIVRPAIVSFGTCSSVAAIPTNMEAAAESGISRDVSDIVIPLGATMHMDGSCFSCVLKVAFVLGVFGRTLTWNMLLPVVFVAVLSSVGMSGVPGGGYIGEYIICAVFFPSQMELAFPILVAIGNLVDPAATMINASGDYVVSFVVSRFVDGKNWLRRSLRR